MDQPWLDDWVHDHPSARPDVREKLGGSVSTAEKWAQAVVAGRDVYAGLLVDEE